MAGTRYGYLKDLVLIVAISATVGHDYEYDSFQDPMLCTEESVGLCFTVVKQAMDWHAAKDYCENMETDSTLASVRSPDQQDFLARQAEEAGLQEVWIGGCLKDNLWHWYGHDDTLAYQGCFVDDENNRDLVNDISSSSIQTPSECIAACGDNEYDLAGVQLSPSGSTMLCHCGDDVGKHGKATDAGCDGACPGKTLPDSGNLLDARCGGVNRQLIFDTEGTTFYSWVPQAERSEGYCAYIKGTPARQWDQGDCDTRRAYVCVLYEWVDENTCRSRRDHAWIGGDTCVLVVSEKLSWWDAMVDCSDYDSYLLPLIQADVQTNLLPLLEDGTSYWTALSFELWEWTIWKEIQYYFNWGRGQPSRGPDQDCLSMKASDDYRWVTSDCERRLPFLCQSVVSDEPVSTPTPTPTPTPGRPRTTTTPDGPAPTAVITQTLILGLGIGAGAMLLLLIAVAIAICLWCRHRSRRRREESSAPSGSTSQVYNPSRPLPARPENTRPEHVVRGVRNPAYSSSQEGVGLHAHPKGKGYEYDNAKKDRDSYAYIDDGYIHPKKFDKSHHYDKLKKGGPSSRRQENKD